MLSDAYNKAASSLHRYGLPERHYTACSSALAQTSREFFMKSVTIKI
jgi:hypothetical protein